MENQLYYNLYAGVLIQCLIILAIILYRLTKYRLRMRDQRLFVAIVVDCAILFSCDFLWTCMSGKAYPLSLSYAVNSLYFCALAAMGYLWLMYVHSVMQTRLSRVPLVRFLSAVPMVIFMAASVSSYWTGWIFYIDENYFYHRGELYVIQTIVGYGYLAWSALSCVVRAFLKENFVYRGKYLVLVSVIVFPGIFGIVQIVIPGLPTLGMGFTLAVIHVYMGILQGMITMDPMTRLNNETRVIQYLSERLLAYQPGDDLCMFVLHLQGLKKINKTFGLDETDDILTEVAFALRQMGKGERYFIGRYSGSKFAIICHDSYTIDTELLMQSLAREIDKALAQKPYHISYTTSYARYRQDITSVSRFIHMAEHGDGDRD